MTVQVNIHRHNSDSTTGISLLPLWVLNKQMKDPYNTCLEKEKGRRKVFHLLGSKLVSRLHDIMHLEYFVSSHK